jgi:hypothetical protein
MSNSEDSDKFVKSFADSRKSLSNLSDQAVVNLILLMQDFRQDALERLRFDRPSDPRAPFNVRILPDLQSSLNSSLHTLKLRTGQEVTDKLELGFDLGQGVTARAMGAANIAVASPQIAPSLLAALSRDTANIYSEMFDELGLAITNQINRSAAGLQSSSQAMKKINRLLRTSPEVRAGQRRRIKFAFQAEEIVRTEMGRAFSSAQQAASEQLADSIPGLKKRWLPVGDGRVRRGHGEAGEAYAPGGSIGPIPIKQKFRIVDYSRTGSTNFMTLGGSASPKGFTGGQVVVKVDRYQRRGRLIVDKMLFPRDPSASSGNVVQCRCVVIDVIPNLEKTLDKSIGIIQQS